MYNVLNKKATASFNIDAYNRRVVAETDLENGEVFVLTDYSTTDGEGEVWVASAPTANATSLWMAASPEVVVVTDAMGNEYKGLTQDPRAFINAAGKIIDAMYLANGDIVEMTGANITGIGSTANVYLITNTGNKLIASATASTGCNLRKVKTSTLNIGSGTIGGAVVPTYVFVVEGN